MGVFLDANVLLEMLLPGRAKADKAEKYAMTEAVVSPLSAHLYVYFGQKEGFSTETLTHNLELLDFANLGQPEVQWAIGNRQDDDFEDALQVACAVSSGCTTFVTLDKKLAKNYAKFIEIKLI